MNRNEGTKREDAGRDVPAIGFAPAGVTGRRPGDLTDLAALLLAELTRGREAAEWVHDKAAEVRGRHGEDRVALLKAAVACLQEEIALLQAEQAYDA
jgi:hypothetical protein